MVCLVEVLDLSLSRKHKILKSKDCLQREKEKNQVSFLIIDIKGVVSCPFNPRKAISMEEVRMQKMKYPSLFGGGWQGGMKMIAEGGSNLKFFRVAWKQNFSDSPVHDRKAQAWDFRWERIGTRAHRARSFDYLKQMGQMMWKRGFLSMAATLLLIL